MKRYIKCNDYELDTAFNSDPNVRADEAHDTTDSDLLDIYAHDPSSMVRAEVAKNKNTSVATLVELTEDSSARVLIRVANNINTPARLSIDIFVKLARSEDLATRISVVESRRAPAEALAILGKDPRWDIRESVATHKNTDLATLELLCHDKDRDVARLASITKFNREHEGLV